MATASIRKQVADQCRVVSHLATALAEVHADYERMLREDIPAMNDILDQVGGRTAGIMETLGDILNGMDAASDEDEWTVPIFKQAQERWPQPPTA